MGRIPETFSSEHCAKEKALLLAWIKLSTNEEIQWLVYWAQEELIKRLVNKLPDKKEVG